MVRQRLQAINNHLINLAENLSDKKSKPKKHELILQTVDYLKNEISCVRNSKFQLDVKTKKTGWNLGKVGDAKNVSGIKFVKSYEEVKNGENNPKLSQFTI